MISEANRSRNPAGHAGLLESLLALASSLADFFESRFALFAQESKGVLVQLIVLGACLILAMSLLVLGWILRIASAVVAVAHLDGTSWWWTALAAAGVHFVAASVSLL